MLEKTPGNTIWRMKSLKWMMDKTVNYSRIYLTPTFSFSVQRNKDKRLDIALALLVLQVFAIQTRRGDLVISPDLKYHPFLYFRWSVSKC